MKMFLEEENKMLKTMVDKIIGAGANVVVCQKGIDDIAQHYLAKSNILAVRRVKESDMTKLAKATGARVISNLEDLTCKDLGSAIWSKNEKWKQTNGSLLKDARIQKLLQFLFEGVHKELLMRQTVHCMMH